LVWVAAYRLRYIYVKSGVAYPDRNLVKSNQAEKIDEVKQSFLF